MKHRLTHRRSIVRDFGSAVIAAATVSSLVRAEQASKRPEFISVATPVRVGVGQILALTENGYTLVRP
jgi:uncharacterized protein